MRCNLQVEGERQITRVRIDFNGKFNMAFAGHCLYDLREALTGQGIPWDSIDLHTEGYIRESHIRESQLAAFEWDGEHGHMLHKQGELKQWGRGR